MAGIGFQLRRLMRQDTISSMIAAAGHAAVIAAGPWLFTIVALASISFVADQISGREQLANFRAIVIYAFAISLVMAAPVTIVATRLVGDALWLKRPQDVRGLLLASYVAAVPPVLLAVAIAGLLLRFDRGAAVALAGASMLVSLIWVSLAFCGAVRDYRGVTLSFLAGLLIALAATLIGAILGLQAVGLSWTFMGGLTVTLFGLTGRIFATFPQAPGALSEGLVKVAAGASRYHRLMVGAFLGAAGVWGDKVVFWLSSEGSRLDNGFLHAPAYDSTMFIASLVIVPALSSLVMSLETGFFDRYQQYFATIANHGTLAQIEAARERLARYTLEHLALITVSLSGLAAIVVLTAPIIIDALGLQFRQIAILRYGALGAVFHFVFIASTSILLFFDRRRRFLILQTLFFCLNVGLAALSIRIGEDYFGMGYFGACLISAAIGYVMAERTFERLNFLTFLGNNPSIVGTGGARSRWLGILRTNLRQVFGRAT
jgi:polysaccharide biosynthesis protein PelG